MRCHQFAFRCVCHPPEKSILKRTCGTVSLGGSAFIAPQTSACRVRPACRYVTTAVVPSADTASWTLDALSARRSDAAAPEAHASVTPAMTANHRPTYSFVAHIGLHRGPPRAMVTP